MSTKACFDFARGNCKRNNCKFSHEISSGPSGTQNTSPSTPSRRGSPASRASGRGSATPRTGGRGGTPAAGANAYLDGSESTFQEWRRSLGREGELDPAQLMNFLQGAIKVIEDGSPDTKQFLVKDLGGEKGLARIRQIVETNFVLTYSVTRPMFQRHCILFLQLISHEKILASLVLEVAVGTIYNVIYGHDGRRGITFFQNVSANLSRAKANPEDSYDLGEGKFEEALAAIAAALLNTIRLNQGAAVQAEFRDIVRTLRSCYDEDENKHSSFAIRSAHQNIERIRERLQMGELIAPVRITDARVAPDALGFSKPFELAVDLPGSFSLAGIRHDNDFSFINNIKILPTTGEILAERHDFLPLKGVDSPYHLTGIHRLLDSQFRLLREDTSGQLRDGIRHLIDNWKILVTGTDEKAKKRVMKQSQTRIRIYNTARMERLRYDRRKGLAMDVSFDQLKKAAGMNKRKRIELWTSSKQLQGGSLVALIGEDKVTTFMLVSTQTIDASQNRDRAREREDSPTKVEGIPEDLASDSSRALITLSLAEPNSPIDQTQIVSLAQNRLSRNLIMVEFPSILYVSFEPILKCLQTLHENPTLPFTKWILPQPKNEPQAGATNHMLGVLRAHQNGVAKVPPPLYLARDRTPLNLSCITKDGQPLSFSVHNPPSSRQLEERTTLDHGQCEALLTGLQNELALIQGPPGTGKSYVGVQLAKVLLANRAHTKIGPIICVCYTNHALDQFLEDLIKSGVEQVIRLGGRSNSPLLQNRTLFAISKGEERTKVEKKEVWSCMNSLDDIENNMEGVCASLLSRLDGWKALKSHLEKKYPSHHNALYGTGVEGEGWTEVVNKAKILENWTQGRGIRDGSRPRMTNRSVGRLLQGDGNDGTFPDVWAMSPVERARLKVYWEQEIRDSIEQELRDAVQTHSTINDTLKKQYRESDKRCLERAYVVGCTTTGLATNAELLRSLPSKVLICEEAAEVLEAHVLTAFLPSVEHAILIGDHLQLRPSVSNYQLSVESERGKKYGLDESLFERLANERFKNNEKFPIAQLDTQRRMHPSISALVRETLYPKLRDHVDTHKHPDVVGMRRRLFWLDHRIMEDSSGDGESSSKANEWEANMVVALVKHLARQGVYQSSDIAVLTPYLGQLKKLNKKLGSVYDLILSDKDQEQLDLEEEDSDAEESPKVLVKGVQRGKLSGAVRVSTVDNFQGDEAKVIIISLVRSNAQRNCGFLKTFNRINVLLSRARNGMYIIGNAETSGSGKVEMWTKVIRLLEDGANIGTELALRCPRHESNRISVSSPEDFLMKSPEGGCAEKCGLRHDCGHTCVTKCHSGPLHRAELCMEDCIKQLPGCGHSCQKRCWATCGLCTMKIDSVPLPCGHIAVSLQCHEAQNLACVKCKQTVTKKIPLCGHDIRIPCHQDIKKAKCMKICGENLPCGHQCNNPCWKCKESDKGGLLKVDHGVCKTICGRSFTTCNHECQRACHGKEACSPCNLPCEVRCSHSQCSKKCNEPCPPCAEQCTWTCSHRERCTMPCAVPCDIIPCSKRCENRLSCGHRCPGVCGEACPRVEFCKDCAQPEILEKTVDFIMYDSYGEVDVDENPIIFLTCGHFYTVSTLDGLMDLKESYEIDPEGKILGPKPSSGVSSGKAPKGCPECRVPLRDIHRYNRVVKLALLDEATRRFVANASKAYMELLDEVSTREKQLEAERNLFITQNAKTEGNSNPAQTKKAMREYKAKSQRLLDKANHFTKSMARSEQPFGKINSMVIDAKRKRNIVTSFTFDEAIIQTGFQYRGQAVCLRLNWAILWDLDTIYNNDTVDLSIRQGLCKDIVNPIGALKKRCSSLRESAKDANLPQHEIEARVYHAQFVALELSYQSKETVPPDGKETREAAIAAARLSEVESLAECERICERFPGTTGYLKDDIAKASRLVGGLSFYSFVSTKEKEEVYRAMATQFSGTGHWYYCANNHPFTVGECGMPMELARCPECGAQVGGQNHTPVAGVSAAFDMEAEFAGAGARRVVVRAPAARPPAARPPAARQVVDVAERPVGRPVVAEHPAARPPAARQVVDVAERPVGRPVVAEHPAARPPAARPPAARPPAARQVVDVAERPAGRPVGAENPAARPPAARQVVDVAERPVGRPVVAEHLAARPPAARQVVDVAERPVGRPVVAEHLAARPPAARPPAARQVVDVAERPAGRPVGAENPAARPPAARQVMDVAERPAGRPVGAENPAARPPAARQVGDIAERPARGPVVAGHLAARPPAARQVADVAERPPRRPVGMEHPAARQVVDIAERPLRRPVGAEHPAARPLGGLSERLAERHRVAELPEARPVVAEHPVARPQVEHVAEQNPVARPREGVAAAYAFLDLFRRRQNPGT